MGIWTLSSAGGTLLKLRDDAFGATPSPDGSRIAFIEEGEVWLMGTNGEDAHKLFAPKEGYFFQRITWSPDGRWLAGLRFHRGHDEPVIESHDLRGSQATVILSDPQLTDFYWAPDWRILYARLENLNEANMNIWELATDPSNSRPSGAPRRLTNWAGFALLDLSAASNGKRISFIRRTEQSDVYVAVLGSSGDRSSAPRRLTLDDRMDWLGGWTHDSKAVLFFSDRNGNFDVFKQGINDRTPEQIVASLSEEKRAPQLSQDGNWVLYLSWPTSRSDRLPPSGHLMRVPVSGGASEVLLEVKGYPGSARVPRDRLPTARGHPDFRCASLPGLGRPCVLSEISNEQVVFYALDPLRGRMGELARINFEPNARFWRALSDIFWDLSPDGSRIAFGMCEPHGGHIRVLDLTSREESEVTVKELACLTSATWSRDGKSLFVTNSASRGDSILRVALNGQTQLLYKSPVIGLERPVPSPDGRYLAYSQVNSTSNVWMIEGF
jgi:Tol biopolymer transport system component